MSKRTAVLGIDTSNYTTSLGVAAVDGEVLLNIKLPLPVKNGEAGLRQSDAVFFHTKGLPLAFERAADVLRECDIVAVGVSERPRDADGSYMPCFLAGVSAASAVSFAGDIPLYRFSHQAGHVTAAVYSAGAGAACADGEFIAFHVSGGTTEMLSCTFEQDGVNARIIGQTLDLNAGQAIDRCGVMLGFPFPCGAHIESAAKEYYKTSERIGGFGVSVKGKDCCLSGLENLCRSAYERTGDKGYVSAFILEYVAKTLIKMTDAALSEYGKLPLVYAGGVMSNSIIKERIAQKHPGAFFALPEHSSDNAVGTALLTLQRYKRKNG